MHNSFYWRRNLGTGTGGGASTPMACYDLQGSIANSVASGTISENLITMTLLPNNLQGTITVEPVTGNVDDTNLEGTVGC